jgi:hypothetical protein
VVVPWVLSVSVLVSVVVWTVRSHKKAGVDRTAEQEFSSPAGLLYTQLNTYMPVEHLAETAAQN